MAIVQSLGGVVNLCTALAGNVVTTNVAQRRGDSSSEKPALLRIVASAGSACSYAIEASPDGVAFFPLATQDISAAGAPGTLTSALTVLGAAGTVWKLLPVDWPWTFLRVTMSANTAMTNTIDLFLMS